MTSRALNIPENLLGVRADEGEDETKDDGPCLIGQPQSRKDSDVQQRLPGRSDLVVVKNALIITMEGTASSPGRASVRRRLLIRCRR